MNRYKVHQRITGRGEHGYCSLAEEIETNRLFLLKVIDINHLSHHEQQQAVSEASSLAQLDHPNLVRYHDSFLGRPNRDGSYRDGNKNGQTTEQSLCVVMELAERGDLSNELEARRKGDDETSWAYMAEDVVLLSFLQLIVAVVYLHGRSVIHRDIRSRNVFLNKGGIVKLADILLQPKIDVPDGRQYYM